MRIKRRDDINSLPASPGREERGCVESIGGIGWVKCDNPIKLSLVVNAAERERTIFREDAPFTSEQRYFNSLLFAKIKRRNVPFSNLLCS